LTRRLASRCVPKVVAEEAAVVVAAAVAASAALALPAGVSSLRLTQMELPVQL